MSEISDRIAAIHERMNAACKGAGCDPASVKLLAVSKTFPVEVIRDAYEAGQLLFGENKVQEVMAKAPELPSKLHWHLIGHLQSNKVRKILPLVDVVQSVDSIDLARDIQRIGGELGLFPKVYLEVNLAEECTKHGFKPTDLREG
ncbi:MAG: YggS family pyridoxal phosphate-dependent enzyme, partial [Prosthecobacter sp.]